MSGSVDKDNFSYDTWFYDLYICNNNKSNEYKKLVFDINHDADYNFKKMEKYCNK